MPTKEELDQLFADLQETAKSCAQYWTENLEDDEGEGEDVLVSETVQ